MSNTKEDRFRRILHQLDVYHRVLLTDLSAMLSVSTDTVRRDIRELDNLGKLKKIHGGAVSIDFDQSSSEYRSYSQEKKEIIAQKAVSLINTDDVVLISGGTTNLAFVKRLPKDLQATFFTPSLVIANELVHHDNIELIFIGGKLSKESRITIGGSAINLLSSIRVDLCFIGTGCLDPVRGLTDFDWEVVQMKKAMINCAKRVISLSISEKLNQAQRYQICEMQHIHTLVTEQDPTDPSLRPYAQGNLTIL